MIDDNNNNNNYPPFLEREDTIGVNDQYEMVTKFAMEPNLGHYGYGEKLNHINKNLLFTNLKTQHNEPERIINQLKNITILKRFVNEKYEYVFTGEYDRVETPEGEVIMKPVYVEQKIKVYRFSNTIDNSSTLVYGVSTTAAGRDGKLLETLKSTFLHKEQTIEDKTNTTKGTWFSNKRGK